MSKKREDTARRRQVTKAKQGTAKPRRKPSGPPPAKKAVEEQHRMADLWIAVGIVALVIAAFAGLYYFSHRPSQTASADVGTPTGEAATPVGEQGLSWSEPPEMALDPDLDYAAVIKTEKGDIYLDLYEDLAPMTVNNFVFLARQGYYDGVTFHRVLPGFVAQTGDPTGTGMGTPGYAFPDEISSEVGHDSEGIVSMANAGPNTNGSQFFITLAPQPQLDGLHTVFGKVTEGMDVVKALTPRDPEENPNAPPGDKIITVEIVERAKQ